MALEIDFRQSSGISVSEMSLKKTIQKIVKEIWGSFNGVNVFIGVALVGDKRMKALNYKFRGVPKTTDVLSVGEIRLKGSKGVPLIGEIIISYPLAQKQASRFGHSVNKELKILIVHALLHISGMDHETDDQRREMQDRETDLIEKGLIKRSC